MNKPNFREWPTLKLSEVLKPISRKVAVESGREYDLIGVRWYNAGAHIHQTLPGENISTKALTQIREDDIIYNKMWVTKNAFAVAKKEHNGAFGTMEYPQFRALPEKLVPKFIEYLFHNPRFQYDAHRLCKGTTGRARLNPSDFLKLEAGIPSLAEQHKIAEILSTWDKAIAKTEQLIAALQERKKGLMQRLLTGEVRFPGFDGEWKEVELGSLGERYSGLSGKTKEDFGEGAPYIPYKNIFNNSAVDLSELDYVSIQEGERQKTVRYGDIFFTTSSETADEVAMSSVLLDDIEECYLNSFCFGFRLYNFSKLIPEFAQYLFRSTDFRRKTFQLAQGFTRYNISKLQLLKLVVNLPEIDEQQKIAKILMACDSEIKLHSQKLSMLQQQKKGLMQRLLTGQVRVKV